MLCDINRCDIKQYSGNPYGDLYQGIEHTVEVAGVEVPFTEEEPKPVLIFNIMDCKVPLSKTLTDLFNSGFYLVATTYLNYSATLFFGVQSNGKMTVMGQTPAVCATYPCEGLVDVKWMIGKEPTMSEFLQMVGLEPLPGVYVFDFSVGYMAGDTPVATDAITVTLNLTEAGTRDNSGLIGPALLTGLGAAIYLV